MFSKRGVELSFFPTFFLSLQTESGDSLLWFIHEHAICDMTLAFSIFELSGVYLSGRKIAAILILDIETVRQYVL